MFQEYLANVQQAIEDHQKQVEKYQKEKEKLSLEVKKNLEIETNKFNSVVLKDYSLVNHHNSITKLLHQFEKNDQDLEKHLQSIKEGLDKKLSNIINFNSGVKEMYKIISACSNNQGYFCRVWFTLVEIEQWKCVPGDPIRIEWVFINPGGARPDDKKTGISATSQRNSAGEKGLNIPQFDTTGRVTSLNNFYPIDNWGANSNQKKWWNVE